MQLEAGEVGHPRQRGGVSRHDFFGRAPGRKAERHDLDPGRPRLGRALLIEELALDAVRVAHQHVRPPAGAAQRAVGDREVVAHEIQLRETGLGKQHLARVRDRDLAASDDETFVFGHAQAPEYPAVGAARTRAGGNRLSDRSSLYMVMGMMSPSEASRPSPGRSPPIPIRVASPSSRPCGSESRSSRSTLVATGIFVLAILHTFAAARFTDLSHSMQHRHDERARAEGRRRRRASPPSCCTSSARSRSSSACGRGAARGDGRLRRLGAGEALLQRHRELHRAPVRGRHHGARVDASDHRLRRSRPAGRGERRAAARPPRGGSRS